MTSHLYNLFIKEVKELVRDPKILVGTVVMPLIMFTILGGIFNTSMTATQEAIKDIAIVVVDQDNGAVSTAFKSFLENSPSFKFKIYFSVNIEDALSKLADNNASGIVLLPEDLSYNISRGTRGQIKAYIALNSFSMVEQGKGSTFQSMINAFNKALSNQIISDNIPSVDPTFVSNPVSAGYVTYFRGKVSNLPPELVYSTFSSQLIMMPIIIMIMLFTTMTMASTAVAIEKETKTLETLLTLPVNRMTILIGKLSGSLLVAVLGTVTYIIGFNYYMSSLLGNQSQMDLSSLGLTTTPMSYALLGLVLFISIVASLAIAVAFSVFSEDVRSAQTSVSYIYVVILIPTFLFMFIDINTLSLPIQLLLYTIPFTHTLAATKEILIGNFSGIFLNVVYLIIFTVVILYIAAKLFTTEKVFTSRFMIRRKVRTE